MVMAWLASFANAISALLEYHLCGRLVSRWLHEDSNASRATFGFAHVVEARAQIALKDQHVGVVDTEFGEQLCRIIVEALLVESQGFLGLG